MLMKNKLSQCGGESLRGQIQNFEFSHFLSIDHNSWLLFAVFSEISLTFQHVVLLLICVVTGKIYQWYTGT